MKRFVCSNCGYELVIPTYIIESFEIVADFIDEYSHVCCGIEQLIDMGEFCCDTPFYHEIS